MLEWCQTHLDQTVALSAVALSALGMVAGAIWWAACIYAEVRAMRVAIDGMGEFKSSVNDDSRQQWSNLDNHDARIGKVEARVSGLESKADIHDREISLLMENKHE